MRALLRHRRVLLAVALLTGATACSDNLVVTAPESAHQVSIAATVPGTCLAAPCTAPAGGPNALGLVKITNSGSSDVFLVACGSGLRLGEEVLVDGKWSVQGPAVLCALPSTPIRLAAGAVLQMNQYFAPGTRRVSVGVTTDGTFATEQSALSGSFRIF